MLSGLFIILLPLVVGYLVPLRQPSALKLINRMLSWIVYVILFFMGISLAFLDNLASNLLAILHYAAVSVVIILLCNIAALLWLESKMPWRSQHRQEKLPSRLAMALESLQLCGVVVLGFLLGLIPAAWVIGKLAEKNRTPLRLALACVAGFAVLYAIGLPYIALIVNVYKGGAVSAAKLATAYMLPYLPGDCLKIVVSVILAPRILKAMGRNS